MISIESYHITVRRVIDKEDHGFNYREWLDLNEKIVVEKKNRNVNYAKNDTVYKFTKWLSINKVRSDDSE